MPALRDDLSDFAGAIVHGEDPSPDISANYRHYSAAIALEIYRNNYRGNLHDTLAGAFPVVQQLVGKDFFRVLARQYIERYPSRSGNLHNYGAEMADFVATFEPAQGLTYLPDVAALEWACHRAYFADDAATFDIASLAQIPPEQYPDLILHVHPACHLVRSIYPVAAIWLAHRSATQSDIPRVDLDSGASIALVSRKDYTVGVSELSAADADWLHAIQTGVPLGNATIATLERHPDFDLQAALLNLAKQDVLTDFNLRTMP
jgi:hypothetical protein